MKASSILMMGSNIPLSLGFGYLYNWYAASNALFPPTDWKVPLISDFATLDTFLGTTDETITFDKMCFNDGSYSYWSIDSEPCNNTSGFKALGSGIRTSTFQGIYEQTIFYATDTTSINAYTIDNIITGGFKPAINSRWVGSSVRLVYDGVGTPTSVTDYDGNIYDVVQIGTQYWTVQNWKCTHLSRSPFTEIPTETDQTAWGNLTTMGRCAYDNLESNV